MEQTARNFK